MTCEVQKYVWGNTDFDLQGFSTLGSAASEFSLNSGQTFNGCRYNFAQNDGFFSEVNKQKVLSKNEQHVKCQKLSKSRSKKYSRSEPHQGLPKNPSPHTCIPEARNSPLRLLVTNILIGCFHDVILTAVISCKAVPHRDLIIFVFPCFASNVDGYAIMKMWRNKHSLFAVSARQFLKCQILLMERLLVNVHVRCREKRNMRIKRSTGCQGVS